MSQSSQISFLVEPLESVFFGLPRSFSAGEAHRADSLFPPSPFTFQGLVRSQLLRGAEPPLDLDDWSAAARQERERLVGSPDILPSGWQLQGPFPARLVRGKDPAEEAWIETLGTCAAFPVRSTAATLARATGEINSSGTERSGQWQCWRILAPVWSARGRN